MREREESSFSSDAKRGGRQWQSPDWYYSRDQKGYKNFEEWFKKINEMLQ